MGDPAGIGPEIVVKALAEKQINDICTPVVVGDFEALSRCADRSEVEFDYQTVGIGELQERIPEGRYICSLDNVAPGLQLGVESAAAGSAAGEYIEAAAALCKLGTFDAIATAPINKASFNLGGYEFPGHTEFLAHLTQTSEFHMSFFAGKLRVVLLSNHVSLANAIEIVKKEKLTSVIRFTDRELGRLMGRKVSIAVAGLNPHASENGMFGNEEELEIAPAIRECTDSFDIDVHGPFSPDTIFNRAFEGEFDAVIACYHDQATIAVKCLSFGKGVNVTLGLPIIRTSVDHGTAFEIAGKNKADSGSMLAAIKLAAELATQSWTTA